MINFTITELRYLIALAEEQHFARAAQKCFVSQPTLSVAIRKLEENLGITVFIRENNRVIISKAGNDVIIQARKILHEVRQLVDIVDRNKSSIQHQINLGAIFTIGPYVFPKLIKYVMKNESSLQLIIEEAYHDDLINQLLNRKLDAVIIATKTNHPELIQIPLCEDKLAVVCSTQHYLTNKQKIEPQDLEKENFLLIDSGNCLREQVLEVYPKWSIDHHPPSMITASSLETIKTMVAMNIGVSILPELALQNLDPAIAVKYFTPKAPIRTISLVYRKNFTRMELIMKIKEQLNLIIRPIQEE